MSTSAPATYCWLRLTKYNESRPPTGQVPSSRSIGGALPSSGRPVKAALPDRCNGPSPSCAGDRCRRHSRRSTRCSKQVLTSRRFYKHIERLPLWSCKRPITPPSPPRHGAARLTQLCVGPPNGSKPALLNRCRSTTWRVNFRCRSATWRAASSVRSAFPRIATGVFCACRLLGVCSRAACRWAKPPVRQALRMLPTSLVHFESGWGSARPPGAARGAPLTRGATKPHRRCRRRNSTDRLRDARGSAKLREG